MSEPKTGLSKRFAIEIDSGKTKTVTTFDRRGRKKGTDEEPIVKRFPPDRTKSLRTQTTYNKDDKTGRLSDPNIKVYQEITKEQWEQLPEELRDSQTGIGARGARPGRSIYYGQIAELPSGQRNYIPTDQVINIIYDEEDADLLRKEAGKYANNEGQFKTVSRVANESVLKNEGLNTNKPDSKNQLGLGKDGPQDVIDQDEQGLKPLPKFGNFNTIAQSGSRAAYGNLKYPFDLRAELQDVMKFTQVQYGALNFNTSEDDPTRIVTGFGTKKRDLGTIRGTATVKSVN